ncbi:S8 family serine peptidase [Phytomonospora sp. NPDC050363]|uniref:S8 family serine peptidase n=1 Tax=Phytomonospora sp. NPDC050363 TaxID=3155642 RepID=UPI0033CF280A
MQWAADNDAAAVNLSLGGDPTDGTDPLSPAVEDLTADTRNDGPHVSADGTSMATPHVTGAVAILKQRHPDWTAARLTSALMGGSAGLDGLGAFQIGAGRLDVVVTAHPGGKPDGAHGGTLVAAADGTTVRTSLGIYVEPEMYDLTLKTIGRDGGEVADFYAAVFNVETCEIYEIAPGTGTLHIPAARYAVFGGVVETGGTPSQTSFSDDVYLTDDTTVTGEAAEGRRNGVDLDHDDAVLHAGLFDTAERDYYTGDGGSGTTVVAADGEEILRYEEAVCSGYGAPLPAGFDGTVAVTCEAHRDVGWSTIGTAAKAEWTFASKPGEDAPAANAVRLDASLVVDGYAPAKLPQVIGLEVYRQVGAAPAKTKSLTFEVSYDEGKTWRKVTVQRSGDHAVAVLRHPAGATSVSTRLSAVDDTGSTVTQTMIRSYGLN